MATTTTTRMTVEQFRQLTEGGSSYYELRHGELVKVTPPELKHHFIQEQIRKLLEPVAGSWGFLTIELGFRALPEYECRIADVAFVRRERLASVDLDDNFLGAPDLVIEVLSPSNTAAEINDKEKLCLENGCQEFWVVDSNLLQVKVSTPDSLTTTYRSGQEIPLRLFGGGSLNVDEIFRTVR